MTEETVFGRWYSRNKSTLSERRREKYRNDADYREKAKKNSADYRRAKSSAEKVPPEYTYTLAKAAEALSISMSRLRDWGQKGYYPSPKRIRGYLYFTDAQLNLIRQHLVGFFDRYGVRAARSQRQELDTTVALVFANWE